MPDINIKIEVNYVTETSTAVQTNQEDQFSDDVTFKLIDIREFVRLFYTQFPQSTVNPKSIWNNLFGHHTSGNREGENPHVRYLTSHSCEKILQHLTLFKNGIDFQHLPAGFFLAKNPQAGGVCDVLHYSDYIAKYQQNVSPLAITLSDKTLNKPLGFESHFEGHQAAWYQFLQSKRTAGDHIYCTQNELQYAFISFSNTVQKLGLEFYQPTFAGSLLGELNPIVLLARWETTLTNRHMKKSDVPAQWQVIHKLPLSLSNEAIRAITDYENEDRACGFIIPEMHLSEANFNLLGGGYRDIHAHKSINSDQSFWRYIAYQPKRNSISFYQQALDHINAMTFNYDANDKWKMYQILAASTTRSNHFAENAQDEASELNTWHGLCGLIDTIESATLTLKAAAKGMIPGTVKHDLLEHFHRLKEQPNIPFVDSIARHITDFIKGLSLFSIATSIAQGKRPLDPLVALSDKLSRLIDIHESNFYHGARFYFDKGVWNTLNVQTYTELQYYLYEQSHEKSELITPYISTFNIRQNNDIDAICQFDINNARKKELNFCLTIFNDVERNNELNKDILIKLINYIQNQPFSGNPFLDIIDHLSVEFPRSFKPGYFAEKRQQLLDANSGLTAAQIDKVRHCNFLPEQQKAIIIIESEMIRRNPQMTDNDLNALNEQFVNFRNVIMADDFTLFTQRLASMKAQFPSDKQAINKLLSLLFRQRSLEDFNQIYLRNKIENCLDDQLINKIIIFIDQIKPLTTDNTVINRLTLQEVLATIVLNTKYKSITAKFSAQIQKLTAAITTIVQSQPHIQHYLLDCFNNIPDKNSDRYLQHVIDFGQVSLKLSQILSAGEDETSKENMLVIYSLFANYHKKPMELTTLFNQLNKLTDIDQQRFMLTYISRLLDNSQSIDGLDALIQQFIASPEKFKLVATQCATPPYPDIQTLSTWLTEENFAAKYAKYSLLPHGPRRIDYAFDLTKYKLQADKFVGATTENLFNENIGSTLAAQLPLNRQATITSLRETFDKLRSKAAFSALNKHEKLQLLSVCIEILARTTSQFDNSVPPRLISQELNSTQVMALYAMLVNPGSKLISEMDTGEGKSRLMMLLAACQAGQGKTVDFITSDLQLAERDYLTYKQFFIALGIRTSLISLSTPKQLYQKSGINFSDNSQLLLLRNKSDITGEPFAYLDEQTDQRCLLIDEVDKFKHDKSKDSYNYAASSKKLAGFIWIYPHLVQFMQQQLQLNPDIKPEPELLIDQLIQYVQNHDANMLHQASLVELNKKNPNQLKTWLHSAYIALKMENDRHYKLTDADDAKLFAVRDADGHTRHTRKILVLDNGRPVDGSSFSDGVQQCLCAKENIASDREEFIILPENETQRSSYPVTFMASYDNGAIYGVSGTSRSAAPRANKDINYEGYDYLIVPRHKKLIREDKNTWVAKDQEQQIKFMKQAMTEKLKSGCPILLICKDDNQSRELHQALNADQDFMTLVNSVQHVHGLTPGVDENNAIKNAGIGRNLTISTAGKFGRGVDINATNLFVIAAYVPTLEDDKQIKGRTARAGKPGEFRMILNTNDPHSPLNGSTYNIDNEVETLQKTKALTAVFHEETSKLYALFLEDVTQKFLKEYHSSTGQKQFELLSNWQLFLGNMQKDWDSHADQLLKLVASEKQQEFTDLFNTFTQKWLTNLPTTPTATIPVLDDVKIVQVYNGLLSQKGFFVPKRQPIKVQRKYDPADDGQARIYSSFFAQEIATFRGERPLFADYRAWKEGRGSLFPDLMATLKGERPLFANLIATIKRWLTEFNEWRHPGKGPAPENGPNDEIETHEFEPSLDVPVFTA